MNFEQVLEIKAKHDDVVKALQEALSQRQQDKVAIYNKYYKGPALGLVPYSKMTDDDRAAYINLRDICNALQLEINKEKELQLFIASYVKNARAALAYNHYVGELSVRKKLHNKPSHYKVIRDAVQDIYNGMPENIKLHRYDLDFILDGDCYGFYYIFSNGYLDPEKLKPVKLEFSDPEKLARANYAIYKKIRDVLKEATEKVKALEDKILTPLGERFTMQHGAGDITSSLKYDAARRLPWELYRKFDE